MDHYSMLVDDLQDSMPYEPDKAQGLDDGLSVMVCAGTNTADYLPNTIRKSNN